MKRFRILTILLLAVILCGCSAFSTEASEAAYNAIEKLRDKTITLDDTEWVEALEVQYQNLSEEEKEDITNYRLLVNAKEVLQSTENSVAEMNTRINALRKELPPEALAELDQLWEQYTQLAEEDQKYVEGEALEELVDLTKSWYDEGSLYAQMIRAQKEGNHTEVLSLGDSFLKAGAPALVKPWYGIVMADSTLALAKETGIEGDALLELYDDNRFNLFPEEAQTELSKLMVAVYIDRIQLMVEQKQYDEALAVIDSVPYLVEKRPEAEDLKEYTGRCYSEKAVALYDKKKYEDASAVALAGLEKEGKITNEQRSELLGIWTDSHIQQADSLIKAKKYRDAYKTLKSAERNDLTSEQKKQLEEKRTALYEKARPQNGAILEKGNSVGHGYGKFEVVNNGEDAIIRIVRMDDEFVYITTDDVTMVYVRGGSKAKFSFTDGAYSVSYMHGDDYVDTTILFASGGTWQSAKSGTLLLGPDMTFETTYSGNKVYYSVNTWTID